MDEWKFCEGTDGRWSWHNVKTDSAGQSADRFATFVDAMANAVQHGFQPGASKIAGIQASPRSKSLSR